MNWRPSDPTTWRERIAKAREDDGLWRPIFLPIPPWSSLYLSALKEIERQVWAATMVPKELLIPSFAPSGFEVCLNPRRYGCTVRFPGLVRALNDADRDDETYKEDREFHKK